MDLEQRLGQSVFISQIGDVVLGHCPHFRSLYVPYVTNMMYQEALVNQLLLVSNLTTFLVLYSSVSQLLGRNPKVGHGAVLIESCLRRQFPSFFIKKKKEFLNCIDL